jgi:hypothetical protein
MCAVMLHVASATAGRHGCPPARAKVIAAGGAARAYRIGRDLYGCYPGVRRVPFGVTKDRSGAAPYTDYDTNVTIAGRYLAFHERDQEPDNSLTFRVYVIDLKSRYTVVQADTGKLDNPRVIGDAGVGPPSVLAVSNRGLVAWIVRDAYSQDGHREVWIASPGRAARRVASGTDIQPTFLRIGPSRLFWQQGGHHASAPLS